MDDQLDRIYHITSIDKCREILLSGKMRPRNQHSVGYGKLDPGNFVHFNFCPKSPMLWNLYQGRCWSADRIYGQADAVYLEFHILSILFDQKLGQANDFIVSDCDVSANGCRRKNLNGDDNIDHCLGEIADFLDVFEINQSVNSINAEEHPKKSAELMFEREICFCKDSVESIGVYDATAKYRLLINKTISKVYGDKIAIKPEWYF